MNKNRNAQKAYRFWRVTEGMLFLFGNRIGSLEEFVKVEVSNLGNASSLRN
ncbi:hypothetical protein [Filifactor alocis]